MKKQILIAILCASLMLITPFTVVARENKISSNLSEQPDIEGLVAQLRVVIDEILHKYGHIPMISNLGNVILKILTWYPGNILYCILLTILAIPLFLIVTFFWATFAVFVQPWSVLLLIVAMEMDLNCPPSTPFFDWAFKSLYTLSETNDITNLIEDCPCLQE